MSRIEPFKVSEVFCAPVAMVQVMSPPKVMAETPVNFPAQFRHSSRSGLSLRGSLVNTALRVSDADRAIVAR